MRNILLRENKIDQDKEHFWIIGLTTSHKISHIEWVSMGSVNNTVVKPMNVFRVAVLKGAVKTILVHNHPSGSLKPSAPDKDVTDRLIQVGRIIEIEVLDHLIITPTSYMSFANLGLMAELQDSTAWKPVYEIEAEIRKEEQALRKEAVRLAGENKAIDIAKKLIKQGLDINAIVEATGLSQVDIKKLG